MLREGDRLPEFALRSSDRDLITQADFLGSPGVLVFFPRAFTAGCRTELRAFQQRLEAFRACGAWVVGVSADTWFENRRFAVVEGLDFPLLSDWPHGRTLATFGVADGAGRARRVTVVFDAAHTIRGVTRDIGPQLHATRALALVQGLVEASRADADRGMDRSPSIAD